MDVATYIPISDLKSSVPRRRTVVPLCHSCDVVLFAVKSPQGEIFGLLAALRPLKCMGSLFLGINAPRKIAVKGAHRFILIYGHG